MREKACKIVLSSQSNQSYVLMLLATLEFQPRTTDVKGLNLDGAESGNGRTRKESWCNLVLPQSNESDVLVLVTLESRPYWIVTCKGLQENSCSTSQSLQVSISPVAAS
jgi:hypothetical protein